MIVYKTEINSSKSKSELKLLIKEKIVQEKELDNLYIFPFCLVSTNFRKDFKRSSKVLFTGEFIENDFRFKRANIVFSKRTNLPLSINGMIDENAIKLKYSVPLNAIVLMIGLSLLVPFILDLNTDFYLITLLFLMLFVIEYCIKIFSIQRAFNRICKE